MKRCKTNEKASTFKEVAFTIGTGGFGPVIRDVAVPSVKKGAEKAKDGIKKTISKAKSKSKEVDGDIREKMQEQIDKSHEKLTEMLNKDSKEEES